MYSIIYIQTTGRETCVPVMIRPSKAGNYLRNRSLVRFHIVGMAVCIRDNHAMRRARAPRRCHHGSGGRNEAVSLLRLRLKESE